MNEDQTQTQSQEAKPGAGRGSKKVRPNVEGPRRGSSKAQEIIAQASAGQGDTGQAIKKAFDARAHALHSILSTRKLTK